MISLIRRILQFVLLMIIDGKSLLNTNKLESLNRDAYIADRYISLSPQTYICESAQFMVLCVKLRCGGSAHGCEL